MEDLWGKGLASTSSRVILTELDRLTEEELGQFTPGLQIFFKFLRYHRDKQDYSSLFEELKSQKPELPANIVAAIIRLLINDEQAYEQFMSSLEETDPRERTDFMNYFNGPLQVAYEKAYDEAYDEAYEKLRHEAYGEVYEKAYKSLQAQLSAKNEEIIKLIESLLPNWDGTPEGLVALLGLTEDDLSRGDH